MAKKTTTQKGLGSRHQAAVDYLKKIHKDGSPCPICQRERWLDPTDNYDYKPGSNHRGNGVLQGDHSGMSRAEAIRRGVPIPPPDRLLHAECNRMRGEGQNDHLLTGVTASKFSMPWPWAD